MKRKFLHSNIDSPIRLFILISLAIFFVELGIMLSLQYFIVLSQPLENFTDAFFLTLIMYPVLYLFIFRPLVRQNKAKTEFVSIVAHQLRTPLTSISWYTEMVLNENMGKITSDQKKYLEEIYKGNRRMIELVDTLLNISRLELGTLVLHKEKIQIKDLAESVLKEMEPQILTKEIIFSKNYDPSLPLISADPQLIRMVFQNLLSNAIKYVENKGRISLDIFVEKSNILIKVWNDGPLIPEEAQSRMFTKFFRDDSVRQKNPDGNGLGLYIVKSVIEKSGGKVWYESPAGGREKGSGNKGVVFFATLPLDKPKNKENMA